MYTADVYSYFTAVREQVVWGNIARVYPKAEGDLFPGLVAVVLAVIGVATWRRDAPAIGAASVSRMAWVLIVAATLHLLAAAATLLYRRVTLDLGLFQVRITNIDQLLLRALVLMTIAAIVSPGYRTRIAEFMRARGFFVLALFLAMWLSLGVSPQTLGRPLNLTGIYAALYEYVPGFDGLRVPARFAMIVGPDARRPRRIRRGGIVAMALGHARVGRADDRIPGRKHRAPVPDQRDGNAARLCHA